MNKMTPFLEQKLVPFAVKFGNNRYVKSISNSLIITIPLTIVGGISLVLASPPVDPELMKPTNFMMKLLLHWYDWAVANNQAIMVPYNLTMGIMALFVAFATAFYLAKEYQENYKDLDTLSSGIISAVVFFVIAAPTDKSGQIDITFLGAQGFFTAMIIGVLTVEVSKFMLKHNVKIKMPEGVPPAVSATFSSLLPMIVNVFLFHVFNLISKGIFKNTIPEAIIKGLTPVLKGTDSVWFVIVMMLICHVLWVVGIHGGRLLVALPLRFTHLTW